MTWREAHDTMTKGELAKIVVSDRRELVLGFMRSLKAKGLLHKDIHGSVVDAYLYHEAHKITPNN